MGLMLRHTDRTRMAWAAAASFALASCSGPDLSQVKVLPKVEGTVVTPNFNEFQKREESRGPITPSDLVDAGGRCSDAGPARAANVASGGQSGDGATPAAGPAMHPISLRMSECEVVRAIGPPQDVLIGSNERGDRAVRLLYKTGDRPGIYHFVEGRLVSIERGAEPPPAAKPPPPKKPKQAT